MIVIVAYVRRHNDRPLRVGLAWKGIGGKNKEFLSLINETKGKGVTT